MKRICISSFDGCKQLNEIHIPSDSQLETIGKVHFLFQKPKVTSIGINAFNCKMLQIIEINNREMISIYEKYFQYYTNALLMIPSE